MSSRTSTMEYVARYEVFHTACIMIDFQKEFHEYDKPSLQLQPLIKNQPSKAYQDLQH